MWNVWRDEHIVARLDDNAYLFGAIVKHEDRVASAHEDCRLRRTVVVIGGRLCGIRAQLGCLDMVYARAQLTQFGMKLIGIAHCGLLVMRAIPR